MMKSFTLKDWMTFLEVYGMPLRLGKYGLGASAEDKGVLLRAVRDLGSDAAAIIPESMQVDFVEAKGASEKPFEGMADYLDKQLSKAVIGQTMTADAGSSKAQAEIHDLVRTDIKKADADQLATCINRMLIDPYTAVNFGPGAVGLWRLSLPVRVARDIEALSTALAKLVPLGLKVRQDEVREPLGLTDPEDDDELLTAPAKAPTPAAGDAPPLRAANRHRLDPRACPGCGTAEPRALNREQDDQGDDQDEIDRMVETLLEDWEPDLEPIVAAVREAAAGATSYAAFEEALNGMAAELPVQRLARRIAVGTVLGRALKAGGTTPDAAE